MQLILNDYSLDGQFKSVEDDFTEYFVNTLRPVMKMLMDKNIPLLKKSDFYSRKISSEMSVGDVLHYTNNPVFTQWKQYIVQMAYEEPYWDNDIRTKKEFGYDTPVYDEIPNCFTEAMERDIPMLSFPHTSFCMPTISCRRDNEMFELINISEYNQLLIEYLLFNSSEIRYVIEKYSYSKGIIVECAVFNGKCHADEALLNNGLCYNDYINIIEGIPQLWEDLSAGKKTDRWGPFSEGLFEYRCRISEGRHFRLFFLLEDKKICFFNGFIKKTQTTPKKELDKAKKLIKEWKRYRGV